MYVLSSSRYKNADWSYWQCGSGRRFHAAWLGVRAVALPIILYVSLISGAPAGAQSFADSFSGFSSNATEPIDIESNSLAVDDVAKTAIFKGNVKAVQGRFTMTSLELHIKYKGDPKNQAVQSNISQIDAVGNVKIISDDNQTATSEWVIFEVNKNLITIGGNVVLKQGQNTLTGNKLTIDLTSGHSRFEQGRVKGVFVPKPGKR